MIFFFTPFKQQQQLRLQKLIISMEHEEKSAHSLLQNNFEFSQKLAIKNISPTLATFHRFDVIFSPLTINLIHWFWALG